MIKNSSLLTFLAATSLISFITIQPVEAMKRDYEDENESSESKGKKQKDTHLNEEERALVNQFFNKDINWKELIPIK